MKSDHNHHHLYSHHHYYSHHHHHWNHHHQYIHHHNHHYYSHHHHYSHHHIMTVIITIIIIISVIIIIITVIITMITVIIISIITSYTFKYKMTSYHINPSCIYMHAFNHQSLLYHIHVYTASYPHTFVATMIESRINFSVPWTINPSTFCGLLAVL